MSVIWQKQGKIPDCETPTCLLRYLIHFKYINLHFSIISFLLLYSLEKFRSYFKLIGLEVGKHKTYLYFISISKFLFRAVVQSMVLSKSEKTERIFNYLIISMTNVRQCDSPSKTLCKEAQSKCKDFTQTISCFLTLSLLRIRIQRKQENKSRKICQIDVQNA